MLVKLNILQESEILQIHGDNLKIDENGQKHITNKKAFYNDADDHKLDNIKYVVYTRSLTVGCDIQVPEFKTGLHLLCSRPYECIN